MLPHTTLRPPQDHYPAVSKCREFCDPTISKRSRYFTSEGLRLFATEAGREHFIDSMDFLGESLAEESPEVKAELKKYPQKYAKNVGENAAIACILSGLAMGLGSLCGGPTAILVPGVYACSGTGFVTSVASRWCLPSRQYCFHEVQVLLHAQEVYEAIASLSGFNTFRAATREVGELRKTKRQAELKLELDNIKGFTRHSFLVSREKLEHLNFIRISAVDSKEEKRSGVKLGSSGE